MFDDLEPGRPVAGMGGSAALVVNEKGTATLQGARGEIPYRLESGRETDLALSGGEDYELLFTFPPADVELLLEAARRAKLKITPIGSITPVREGRVLIREDGATEPLAESGWDHFRESP